MKINGSQSSSRLAEFEEHIREVLTNPKKSCSETSVFEKMNEMPGAKVKPIVSGLPERLFEGLDISAPEAFERSLRVVLKDKFFFEVTKVGFGFLAESKARQVEFARLEAFFDEIILLHLFKTDSEMLVVLNKVSSDAFRAHSGEVIAGGMKLENTYFLDPKTSPLEYKRFFGYGEETLPFCKRTPHFWADIDVAVDKSSFRGMSQAEINEAWDSIIALSNRDRIAGVRKSGLVRPEDVE